MLTFSKRSPSKRIAGICFITFLSSSKLANNSGDTSQISNECVNVSCKNTNEVVKHCTKNNPHHKVNQTAAMVMKHSLDQRNDQEFDGTIKQHLSSIVVI